jgi:hypothetical protein
MFTKILITRDKTLIKSLNIEIFTLNCLVVSRSLIVTELSLMESLSIVIQKGVPISSFLHTFYHTT